MKRHILAWSIIIISGIIANFIPHNMQFMFGVIIGAIIEYLALYNAIMGD